MSRSFSTLTVLSRASSLVLLLDVRLLGGGTGVVDQRGERPHLVLGPAEHRLDIVFGADIRAHRHGTAARAGDGRYHRLRPVRIGRVVHDHAVAVASQPFGDRGAAPPAGARDNHTALVLYSRSHLIPPSSVHPRKRRDFR